MKNSIRNYSALFILTVILPALSCSILSAETEVLAHIHDKFSLTVTCGSNAGSDSYGQHLRVSVGNREIFKSFTRDFDNLHDCATSLNHIEVVEGSVILLPYYDRTQVYEVESMRSFSK